MRPPMSLISNFVDAVIPKNHDFSTERLKKKAINEFFDQMISNIDRREYLRYDSLENPILDRRKRALLNFISQPEEVLQSCGIKGYEDRFLLYEVAPYSSYDLLNDDYCISLAAALWILDDLNRSGKIFEAYKYLPRDEDEVYDKIYVPWDLVHHSYSYNLILSVMYVLEYRHDSRYFVVTDERTASRPDNWNTLPKSENRKNYEGLMSLLNEERVLAVCRHFEELHTEVIRRFMECTTAIHEKTIRMAEEIRRNEQSSILMRTVSSAADSAELIKDIDRNQQKIKAFIEEFPYLLMAEEEEIKQYVGNRKLTKIMQGLQIDDPYEICFALFALTDRGSDIPWLFSGCLALLEAASTLLPWRYTDPEISEEFWDEEDEQKENERVEMLNRWKKQPYSDPVDLYHTKFDYKGGKRNLSQIIFDVSNGIMTPGAHPYEEIRQELISSGMDELFADYAGGIMEQMFFSDRKYVADNLRGENSLWRMLDGEDHEESGEPDSSEEVLAESEDKQDDPERKQNSDVIKEEAPEIIIRRLKQENKNLRKALSENNAAYTKRIAKTEIELKSLRREHRELADLRTILFNQENEAEEEQEHSSVGFPYTPSKRTVVFGGHDSFLKVIRPMLPEIRFVDPSSLNFDAALLRNTEIIWIQNNCISHSQYWKVINYARQHGIQLRYFAYASAEKCAEQLAMEDQRKQ